MKAEVDWLSVLSHAIEVRLKLKLKELNVEHQLVLAIAFKLFEALFDLIVGYKDVLAGADLLYQDISAEYLIALVCVNSDEGVLTPD